MPILTNCGISVSRQRFCQAEFVEAGRMTCGRVDHRGPAGGIGLRHVLSGIGMIPLNVNVSITI